ncbi:zinc finger MYM-type protein 1-like [Aphis craccivora]|uniref:Zinc finger MYM-type protein 1-like n=1 Tax=Aphis craccivora TaxID=307492 RepID=A0A6G0VYX1_APHCR|nr:zinc finger MYM-type protein 1-like [Aphis craccivora]
MIFPSKIVEAKATNNDNASNMLGKYTGVRARIKDKCDFATFVPCTGHSLNLVGVHDAGCVLEATKDLKLFAIMYSVFDRNFYFLLYRPPVAQLGFFQGRYPPVAKFQTTTI